MITLLSALIGLLTSSLPSLLSLWEKSIDYKHDIEVLKLQGELAKENLDITNEIEQAKADSVEQQYTHTDDDIAVGSSFIDKLRASVRPITTYLFLFFFLISKITVALVMFLRATDPFIILSTIWDQYTISLFTVMVTYYFGSRQFSKFAITPASKT